jgi:hypothetical protein
MAIVKYRFRRGVTLIETIIGSIVSVIIILSVGVLVVGGNRAWQKTYNSANKKIKLDADAITIAFGSMGRRANRLNYFIYKVNGGNFTPALPQTSNPEEVVSGDAVEFRYWDVELDKTDSLGLIDVEKIATAYALFYLDGDRLKVDYGPYPPGAVPAGGGGRTTSGVRTVVLAENASTDPNSGAGPFSHTTVSKVGQGSVRINCLLTDPEDGEIINVKTSTFLRNIWPR